MKINREFLEGLYTLFIYVHGTWGSEYLIMHIFVRPWCLHSHYQSCILVGVPQNCVNYNHLADIINCTELGTEESLYQADNATLAKYHY